MDAIPIFSQVKSLVQVISGDHKGAKATQKNFLKLCPGVSQGTSVVQALSGDKEGAKETQKQFLKGMNGALDSLPVVGHVKGTVHYICGDKEGGHNAMKAATRTTGVMAGGVGGFLVGGPVGATVGGMMAGVAMDEAISITDVLVCKEKQLYGTLGIIQHIVEDPKNGGNYVDLIGSIALDGATGYAGGKGLGRKIEYKVQKGKLQNVVGKGAVKQIVDAGESIREIRSTTTIKGNKPHVLTIAEDLQTGKKYKGQNLQIRKILKDNNDMAGGPTELQKRVPDARLPLKRNPATCAEQQAYSRLYKDRVNAEPGQIRSVSVKMSKNHRRPVTVERCENCKQFSPAMGSVPTDIIGEKIVPKRVGLKTLSAYSALGLGICALDEESKHLSKNTV
ncbi:uncharacterized protein LOC114661984 [Erpetoichthys calabaricus]|uniref:uncharacterized protein LOC114661984 n=1 Tax=Erpetoichthys calabaricus TaxID=27687 RepID=UPI0010A0B806|nr:uncharacterized protein LOC114661984 [Erpetoichthys calabaricus]